jgi:PAS domain S-box-containing protein
MFSGSHLRLIPLGIALVLILLALILVFTTPLGAIDFFLLLIVAIILNARFGDWKLGLFVALFAWVTTIYFFLPSIGAFTIASFGLIALFLVILMSRDFNAQTKSAQDIARLVAIVNSSEDAIVTKTLDGTIQTWNPSAERLFGYSAAEMIGNSIRIIYPPERLDEFQRILERLGRGESINHFDTVRVTKDERRINVSIGETLMHDTHGNVLGVSKVMRDITARKHAEETARFLAEVNEVLASSLDYETTLASIARIAVPHIADWCAVYITLEDGTIQQLALTHVDPTKVELAHELQRRYLTNPKVPYSVPNVIQTGKPELAPPFSDEQGTSAPDDAALKISPDPGLKSLMVVPLIAPGRTFGAITFVSAESGRFYGQADLELAQDLARRAALAMDNARLYHTARSLNAELDQHVAERTRELQEANRKLGIEIIEHQSAREQLRLLAAHLQSAREEERIKIARAIHDEVGTLMTAIKMDLAFLDREINGSGPKKSPAALHEEIGATTKLVDDAIETVHQIARELRPGVLDHLGLRAALEWQMQEFQERVKIECKFNSDLDEFNLDPARSTAVFRIMQETLTNVARHSHATHVEASLRQEENTLILEVRDNGKGIPATPNANRFGILGMRERAHVFGGEVTIEGAPEQGTVVVVRIPVL